MGNYRRILLLFAGIASAAMTACAISGGQETGGGETGTPSDSSKALTIRIAGVGSASTRAVEPQGSSAANTVLLQNGHIFVYDTGNKLIANEALNVDYARGELGQLLKDRVPADSRVFILANIPAAGTVPATLVDDNSTFDELTAYESSITAQSDYKTVVLTNDTGAPAGITVDGTTAAVTIRLKPVISRLELVALKGHTGVKSFNVTGVFLDSYYPRFTFGGGHAGTVVEHGRGTDFTGVPGDTGTWAGTTDAASGLLVAAPPKQAGTDAAQVWAHNVAAGGKPRLIIRLNNLNYDIVDDNYDLADSEVRYLTVVNYTDIEEETFRRGRIYRINAIEFDWRKFADTPNPEGFNLSVAIEIAEWEIAATDAEIF